MEREHIGLDFETYCGVDLTVHGLDRYVNDPTFLPLIGATWCRVYQGPMVHSQHDFVLGDREEQYRALHQVIGDRLIVAHNAGFERAVLHQMGLVYPADRFVDSAVVARGAGAGGKLEVAAPQLLGIEKMEMGQNLIKIFSIPNSKYQTGDDLSFNPQVVEDHPDEWKMFMSYCELDAELSFKIVDLYGDIFPEKEYRYAAVTMEMNATGWHVDVEMVEEMNRRYLENQQYALTQFLQNHDPYAGTDKQLNLSSYKQVMDWCKERGIKLPGTDEKSLARVEKRLRARLAAADDNTKPLDKIQYNNYRAVLDLIETKQMLGGSALKKLQTILDTTSADGRLRDQYLHIGAGQSYRTTGRSVQMQNLKRIGESPDNMEELRDTAVTWDNDQLAKNIRQVFTASEPEGALIVGDFSSVEARGLAWAAGEEWKLEAFRKGQDLYKVAADRRFNVGLDNITKDQRMFGKVGELSCGYQAGPGAVQSFAAGMGIELTELEAAEVVSSFRSSNPKVVEFWDWMHEALLRVVTEGTFSRYVLPDRFVLELHVADTPVSLESLNPQARSITMVVWAPGGSLFMRRIFHGCYMRGRDICYYKPTERKTGDLWSPTYTNPKTKQTEHHKLYGGKLTGIFVQSFCRELFMQCLLEVDRWVNQYDNLKLVGQFHDEIVLEWTPDHTGYGIPRESAKAKLEELMSNPMAARTFPLAADVKHDYRYTK